MLIKRGDVLYADLGPVIGSEQDGIRPVVVLQNDIGNKYSPTIIVSPVTTKTKANLPTHILITTNQSGLPKESIILVEQIRTIDKARIVSKVGHLSERVMDRVKEALKISFNIRGDIFEFLDNL